MPLAGLLPIAVARLTGGDGRLEPIGPLHEADNAAPSADWQTSTDKIVPP
jgi:hypothetical protein